MILKNMTKEDAQKICEWKYLGEYSVYNVGGWVSAVSNNFGITKSDVRKKQFRVVYNDNKEILGYFRFREENGKTILGLGLHPEKCGKGIGKEFINFILNTQELKNKIITLEVRSFNKRAIKCYQSVGFELVDKIEKETLNGNGLFLIMEKRY